MRHAWLPLTAAAVALATLIGCGGSTGDSSASNPPAGGGSGISTTEQATARIDVDLIAGTTKVTPMNAAQSRSLFTGSSVSVTASPVSTQPGELTVKKVRLNIKNNTADAIGLDDDVLLVVDRVATDDLGGLNLREFSNVATVIGPGSSANDGPGSTVTISQPSGVDVDSEGTLYVAGQGDGSLRKLRDDYVTRLATGLATPGGVAALPGSDFLFVTEQSTHNIVRVPRTGGAKFVIAGGGAAGLTDGSGAAARFNLPRDIAIIGSTAFVADYTNDRIRRLTNLTGSAATVSTLNVFPVIARPSGVAHLNLGGVDWLVVPSTQTNKVHLVNSANGQSFIIAGTGAAGSADGAGGTATFNQPSDAAVIGSAVFITDLGGRIIRQLNLKSGAEPSFASSWVVKTLAGSGSNGSADGGGSVAQFGSPRYLAADRSGSLYATDLTNNRVRRITGVSGTLPITGTGGSGGTVNVANPDHFLPAPDFAPARAAFLLPDLQPSGQAGDSAEKDIEFVISSGVSSFSFFVSVVADGDSIAVLDAVANSTTNLKGSPNVNVRTLVGRNVSGFDDGDAATATYSYPTIAVCRNAIYSIGSSQALVRRFDLATGVTRSIAGLAAGSTTAAGTGTTSSIPGPIGLWVNENETEIYVVTARHVVVRLSRTSGLASDSDSWTVAIIAGLDGNSGNITGSGSSARFNIPAGIVADSTGSTLYICDALNNCVKKMTILGDLNRNVASNWTVSQFAGSTSGVGGFVDGTGSFARFDTPLGITASRDGTLYVTESDGNRIRRVQLNASVSLLAGSVDGIAESVDEIGPDARFNQPRGITLDESGFAYVADTASNCVRRVNLKSLEVTTVAGQRGVLGILDGSGSSCLLNLPYSVSFRPGLGLYVSDSTTLRVIERTIRTGQP